MMTDPTFGRWDRPALAWQQEHLANNGVIASAPRKAYILDGGPYDQIPSSPMPNHCETRNRWISYKCYQLADRVGHESKVDLVLYHATDMLTVLLKSPSEDIEYSPWICQVSVAAYSPCRLHRPMLIRSTVHHMGYQHGGSTGKHGRIEEATDLVSAAFAVLSDALSNRDSFLTSPPKRVALSGISLGGLGALLSGLWYCNRSHEWDSKFGIEIAGVYALCPVTGSERTQIVSEDPRVWQDAVEDRQSQTTTSVTFSMLIPANTALCYTERMPLHVAKCGLEGMYDIHARAATYNIPIRIIHGAKDTNTSHIASEKFIARIGRDDSTIRILPNHDHTIVKINPKDSFENEVVLSDWLAWLASL